MTTSLPAQRMDSRPVAERAVFSIILALSFSHFLNDTMQSLVPALYPMMKDSYGLSFAQIGLITLAMQVVSSLLQPMVGLFADHRPQPYSLAAGMGATFIGLLLLANADAGGGLGRHRLRRVPPGGVAGRAHGLGRAARARAILVSGRRQCRFGDRADPG